MPKQLYCVYADNVLYYFALMPIHLFLGVLEECFVFKIKGEHGAFKKEHLVAHCTFVPGKDCL